MATVATRPVVGFDLDGVVMRNAFVEAVAPRIREELRRSPALGDLTPKEAGARVTEALRQASRKRLAAGDLVGACDWEGIYAEVAGDLGAEPTLDLAGIFRQACESDGVLELLPGARGCLEALRAAGLGVVAITNGHHAFQWPALEGLDVAHLFDAVVAPDTAGYAKPDPRLFRSVTGLVAHVGDALLADVMGANRAGLFSVWVHAKLSEPVRSTHPADRTAHPAFPRLLEERLADSYARDCYPDATTQTCTPGAVVVDLAEALDVLLTRFGAQGGVEGGTSSGPRSR